MVETDKIIPDRYTVSICRDIWHHNCSITKRLSDFISYIVDYCRIEYGEIIPDGYKVLIYRWASRPMAFGCDRYVKARRSLENDNQ